MEEECAEVVVNVNHPRLDRIYHYRVPEHWERPEVGVRVTVPFGYQTVQGWLVGYSSPPAGIPLKEISGVSSPEPVLTRELIAIARWMAEHYLHPLSEILKIMTPPERPRRRLRSPVPLKILSPPRPGKVILTREQVVALKEIISSLRAREARRFLLYGVTGSGKTEVYLRAAAAAISLGRQVLYLVPEIALTPQAGAWFRAVFGERVAVWHSRLSRGEKYRIWEGVKRGELRVLIGPRSAVLAPFSDLGLIVVDEEHDPSYKQQEKPYYHARDVAEQRALLNKAVLVLGSATPSLESYNRAGEGSYRLLTMFRRPQGRTFPRISVIDLRTEQDLGAGFLSRYLREQIQLRLERREQVILFLNRRGFAPLVFCPVCGYVLKCKNCSISLVYHRTTGDLRCHYCNSRCRLPERCPWCGSAKKLTLLGSGTQRVEYFIRRLYPEARIQRLDLDATRKREAFARILDSFARKEIDILLGTQMVTKGHDFPGVTLVGVLNADLALNLPDYRAAERTFQLLTQVAGRAGRGRIPGEVVIQTYHPGHYSIWSACRRDYLSFYREEIRNRAYLGYPPFEELIRVRILGEREQEVKSLASALAEEFRELLQEAPVAVLGPAPAPVLKARGYYRWQIMLKGKCSGSHGKIKACLDRYYDKTNVIINVEVDPFGF
ncbi:MAG: primosomal protein N' [Firmicutes bacterium]|nr:primosomal protein N' [Bacillota bacterium]